MKSPSPFKRWIGLLEWSDVSLAMVPVAFLVLLLAWRRSLDVTFFALSADDFGRTLLAWDVTRGRLVPDDTWPPLQFWVEALVLKAYPHILEVPMLVNLTASTLTLLFLILLGRTLRLSRIGILLLIVLVASMPWYIWLSLSGLADSLYCAGIVVAYLGVALWQIRNRAWGLWIATVGLLGAGMLRFEGWGYSAVFSLVVIWFWWRTPQPRPRSWMLAAATPWIFPIGWLVYQYSKYGNPFYFSSVVRDYFLHSHGTIPLIERLTWEPNNLWNVAGVTVILALAGTWLMRRTPSVGLLILMWFGSFGFLMLSTLSYTISLSNPVRLVVIHAVLLAVGAAFALQRLSEINRVGTLAVAVFVLALVLSRVPAIPNYPNGLAQDVMSVGQHFDELRATGQLRPGERIMLEVIIWDYVPLHVLSKDPGVVVYDRPPTLVNKPGVGSVLDDDTNPSLLVLPEEEVRTILLNRGVRVVVSYSSRAVENLRHIGRETFQSGRFHIFVVGN